MAAGGHGWNWASYRNRVKYTCQPYNSKGRQTAGCWLNLKMWADCHYCWTPGIRPAIQVRPRPWTRSQGTSRAHTITSGRETSMQRDVSFPRASCGSNCWQATVPRIRPRSRSTADPVLLPATMFWPPPRPDCRCRDFTRDHGASGARTRRDRWRAGINQAGCDAAGTRHTV